MSFIPYLPGPVRALLAVGVLAGVGLGGRGDDAADDHGQDEIARAVGLVRVPRPEQPVQTDRTRHPQNRGDRPMRQGAVDDERLLARRQHHPALEHAAQALDVLGWPVAEVEKGALPHALSVPVALAQQDRRWGAAVGTVSMYMAEQ